MDRDERCTMTGPFRVYGTCPCGGCSARRLRKCMEDLRANKKKFDEIMDKPRWWPSKTAHLCWKKPIDLKALLKKNLEK